MVVEAGAIDSLVGLKVLLPSLAVAAAEIIIEAVAGQYWAKIG